MALGGRSLLMAGAVVAAVAASPLRPVSLRELLLVLVGNFLGVAVSVAVIMSTSNSNKNSNTIRSRSKGDDTHTVRTVRELRQLLPPGWGGTGLEDAQKRIGYLDDQMMDFVSKSPLLYLATVDPVTHMPLVSPKGDQPGFVTVLSRPNGSLPPHHTLIIPDRPGNRLLLGLQNIVGHSNSVNKNSTTTSTAAKVSVLFEVPGTGTTLRCGGSASLSTDPALLQTHVARGCPPRVVIRVDVEYAFFHCAKAYLRSRVWDLTSWPSPPLKITFGRYFAKPGGVLARKIDADVDQHYQEVQKAVDGEACERER